MIFVKSCNLINRLDYIPGDKYDFSLARNGIYKLTLEDIEIKGVVSFGILPFFYTLTDNGN